jgi:hypothetical protein
MKTLITTLIVILSSNTALAQIDCNFTSESSFTCNFQGTSGLEIFEDLDENQVESNQILGESAKVTFLYQPQLKGYHFDIDFCVAKVENKSKNASATCTLKSEDHQSLSTARPTPNKKVIRRIDVR